MNSLKLYLRQNRIYLKSKIFVNLNIYHHLIKMEL